MERTLRVLVVLKTNTGGKWIIEQVEELIRRGHTVAVVLPQAPGDLDLELKRRHIEVIVSPFDFRFRPSARTLTRLWKLRKEIQRFRPDVIKYHLYASALASRFASIGLSAKRVHMVAGPLFLENRLIRTAERFLCRLDDLVICGCEHTSRLYGGLGLPAQRRTTVSYGVDTKRFSIEALIEETVSEFAGLGARQETKRALKSSVRADLGIGDDDFVVIMVAYVYPPRKSVHNGRAIKGHDVLFDAWAQFEQSHQGAKLLLIGGGHLETGEAHRRYLMERYQVDEDPTIQWLSSVPDVRRYYAAADVSVSPSLSEGHGAALEASAMGVPLIVSDAGGLPETVDAASGWLVKRGDATLLLETLEAAHNEFRTVGLDSKADGARERATTLFDRSDSIRHVADAVEHTVGSYRPRSDVLPQT